MRQRAEKKTRQEHLKKSLWKIFQVYELELNHDLFGSYAIQIKTIIHLKIRINEFDEYK